MKRRKSNNRGVYQALTMITQFGINMLVPICMMSAVGWYLDDRFGTSFWTVLLFFIGAIAGGQNVYRMAKNIYDAPPDESKKETKQEHEGNGSIKKDQ